MNQTEPNGQSTRSPMPPNRAEELPSTAAVPAEASSTPPTLPTEENPAPREPAGRARAKKILIGLLIALVVLLLLNLIPFDRIAASLRSDESITEPVETYPINLFSPADYDEDVTLDEQYQTKYNLLMTFATGNESFAVTAETAASHGPVCAMFQDYFEALMAGDNDACNSFFSEAYLEKNGKFNIAPQKIYDMKVSVEQHTYLEKGDANGAYTGYNHYYCQVSYKIRHNNGTLRRDFYKEGVSIPQMYEVVEKDGKATITMISNIRIGAPDGEKGNSIMLYTIWIAVIAFAILIEASSATLVAIWFMPGALVSLILALCGLSLQTQVLVFFLLSLVLTVLGTLVFRKKLLKRKNIPTNIDRIIEMEGVVTEPIDNLAATGEVKADGKRWSARSEDGSPIEEGAIVTILRIEGVKLIVRKK